MTGGEQEALLDGFLAGEGRELRRLAYLVTRSWARADELLAATDRAGDAPGRLLEALATLPVLERIAVVLTHFCRLDEAAVAEALGRPAPEATTLTTHGVERLQAILSTHGDQLLLPTDDAHARWARPETTHEIFGA